MTYVSWIRHGISLLFTAGVVAASDQSVIYLTSIAGRNVDLTCHPAMRNHDPDWTFQGVNRTTKYVANEGEVIDDYKTRAAISKTPDIVNVTLRILDVQIEDEGSYRCIEDAGAGRSILFHLTVAETPTYTSTHILREGLPAILPCFDSSGRAGKWQFLPQSSNGASEGPKDITRNEKLINGWTSKCAIERLFPGDCSLTVLSMTADDSGIYTCIVNDEAKYQYIINVSGGANNMVSIETSSWLTAFVCQFPNTTKFRWYRERAIDWDMLYNGYNVTEQSGRLHVYNTSESSVLFINSTTPSDTGRYRCSPWNTNRNSNMFDLNVNGKTTSAPNVSDLTTAAFQHDRFTAEMSGKTSSATTYSAYTTRPDVTTQGSQREEPNVEQPAGCNSSIVIGLLVSTVVLGLAVIVLFILVVSVVTKIDKKKRTWKLFIPSCTKGANATNNEMQQLIPLTTERSQRAGPNAELPASLPPVTKTDEESIKPSTSGHRSDRVNQSSRNSQEDANDEIVSTAVAVSEQSETPGEESSQARNNECATRDTPEFELANQMGLDVRGVCVIEDRLFVARHLQSDIDVYDKHTMQPVDHLPVTGEGSDKPRCMACDTSERTLYITYFIAKIVRRVQVADKKCTEWGISDEPDGVAVMPSSNVLVVLKDACKLVEFKPNGQLIKTILFERPVGQPRYAMPFGSNKFLVCYGVRGQTDCGLCLVNYDGEIDETVDSRTEHPLHLTSGPNGSVLVADFFDNKVVRLDQNLCYVCDIVSRDLGVSQPYRLCYDDERKILYVGEFNGRADLYSMQL